MGGTTEWTSAKGICESTSSPHRKLVSSVSLIEIACVSRDAVYYEVSFRGRMVYRSYGDFKQLEQLCWKQKRPALPQPQSEAESTFNAMSLMEGQCLLARKLDDWLAALAQGLLDGNEPNVGLTPVFLAFLGVLFTDKAADHAADRLEDSSSDDSSDSEDELEATVSSAGDDDGGGADLRGSPWKMVQGGEATRSADLNGTTIPCPPMLSSYFVAAVEWRVNYAFRVSQIPGLKTGAHSVFVATLQNGNGGEHQLLIDATTEKVRLRLLPPRRMGEWRHRNDPGTAVLFKRAQLSDDLYRPGGASCARDAHNRASEGGVCSSPVRPSSELW